MGISETGVSQLRQIFYLKDRLDWELYLENGASGNPPPLDKEIAEMINQQKDFSTPAQKLVDEFLNKYPSDVKKTARFIEGELRIPVKSSGSIFKYFFRLLDKNDSHKDLNSLLGKLSKLSLSPKGFRVLSQALYILDTLLYDQFLAQGDGKSSAPLSKETADIWDDPNGGYTLAFKSLMLKVGQADLAALKAKFDIPPKENPYAYLSRTFLLRGDNSEDLIALLARLDQKEAEADLEESAARAGMVYRLDTRASGNYIPQSLSLLADKDQFGFASETAGIFRWSFLSIPQYTLGLEASGDFIYSGINGDEAGQDWLSQSKGDFNFALFGEGSINFAASVGYHGNIIDYPNGVGTNNLFASAGLAAAFGASNLYFGPEAAFSYAGLEDITYKLTPGLRMGIGPVTMGLNYVWTHSLAEDDPENLHGGRLGLIMRTKKVFLDIEGGVNFTTDAFPASADFKARALFPMVPRHYCDLGLFADYDLLLHGQQHLAQAGLGVGYVYNRRDFRISAKFQTGALVGFEFQPQGTIGMFFGGIVGFSWGHGLSEPGLFEDFNLMTMRSVMQESDLLKEMRFLNNF